MRKHSHVVQMGRQTGQPDLLFSFHDGIENNHVALYEKNKQFNVDGTTNTEKIMTMTMIVVDNFFQCCL